MNKKDFIGKAKNILVTATTGAVVTSGFTSCRDYSNQVKEWEKINPEAMVKSGIDHKILYLEADKKTD